MSNTFAKYYIQIYIEVISLKATMALTPAQKQLYDYPGLNFALYRQAIKTNVPIHTFIDDPYSEPITKEELISTITGQTNTEFLADIVTRRNDIGLSVDRNIIIDKVKSYLTSWINLGRFDTIDVFVSFQLAVDYYNKEFVREFADTIIPIDVVKVPNVVNPNGMFVQQSQTLSFKSRKIPFYERALYKRLEAKHIEDRIDETESFFYKFKDTKKNIPQVQRPASSLDRAGIHFSMKPKY